MDYKKIKHRTLLTAAVTGALYSFITGKGPFNKIRFKEQHEELARYVDNNYPNCSYSAINLHGTGWSSSIKRSGRVISYVYFSKSADGVYVFTESTQKLN